MIDTAPLKTIDIKEVWQALGYELRGGGNARCFGSAHKNGDRNPSMGLDTKANRFKCFTCDIQGDTIELVQQALGVDFKEATGWLSDKFGVGVEHFTPKNDYSYITHQKTPIKAPTSFIQDPIRNASFSYQLPEHIGIYKAFYNYCTKPDQKLLKFWRGRGLSDDLLKQAGWRTITKDTWVTMAKEYTPKELLLAGLLTERPNGQLKPLFYNHSVVVPYFDGDDLIYLRARSLDPDAKAKYLAPKGTSPPVYNYQAVCNYDGERPLFITESETDALALSDMGEVAVALVGGQKHPDSLVVRELAHLITKGLSPKIEVSIVADRDTTGEQFFSNVAKALYIAGLPSNNINKYQCDAEYKDIGEQLRQERATK